MTGRLLACFLAAAVLMVPALAQSPGPASGQEFERGSGGQVELLTKGPRKLSGSLTMSTSNGAGGYGATMGGTLLDDRLWFFGAASTLPGMAPRVDAEAIDLRMDARLGARSSVDAAWSAIGSAATPDSSHTRIDSMPSTFLSLRYTGIVSNNLFFNATIMRRTATYPSTVPLDSPR